MNDFLFRSEINHERGMPYENDGLMLMECFFPL